MLKGRRFEFFIQVMTGLGLLLTVGLLIWTLVTLVNCQESDPSCEVTASERETEIILAVIQLLFCVDLERFLCYLMCYQGKSREILGTIFDITCIALDLTIGASNGVILGVSIGRLVVNSLICLYTFYWPSKDKYYVGKNPSSEERTLLDNKNPVQSA